MPNRPKQAASSGWIRWCRMKTEIDAFIGSEEDDLTRGQLARSIYASAKGRHRRRAHAARRCARIGALGTRFRCGSGRRVLQRRRVTGPHFLRVPECGCIPCGIRSADPAFWLPEQTRAQETKRARPPARERVSTWRKSGDSKPPVVLIHVRIRVECLNQISKLQVPHLIRAPHGFFFFCAMEIRDRRLRHQEKAKNAQMYISHGRAQSECAGSEIVHHIKPPCFCGDASR